MIRERLQAVRKELLQVNAALVSPSDEEFVEMQKTGLGKYVMLLATNINRIIGLLVRVIDSLP